VNIEDYPSQEPLSKLGRPYHDTVLQLPHGDAPDEYNYGADPYQSLAVFKPAQVNGAVLIMWHGGGWTNGYKEWMYFMAPAVTAAGITFVSAGYRLAPQHVFPAGLLDCADAVAWVYEHAASIGADPARLFLSGHSAGGHYASLLGVSTGWHDRTGVPQHAVRGCLPISGVYDFGDASGLSMRPRFLGTSENAAKAGPIANIERTLPFLIAYGSDDFPHLRAQAHAMESELNRRGGDVESIELADCDHLGASYAAGAIGGAWISAAAAWIESR
jgi:arylformamidase